MISMTTLYRGHDLEFVLTASECEAVAPVEPAGARATKISALSSLKNSVSNKTVIFIFSIAMNPGVCNIGSS